LGQTTDSQFGVHGRTLAEVGVDYSLNYYNRQVPRTETSAQAFHNTIFSIKHGYASLA